MNSLTIVLDTNILIEVEGKNQSVLKKLEKIRSNHPQQPHITSINFSEFYYGCLNKTKKKKDAVFKELNKYGLLNTTRDSSVIFSELKHDFETKGKSMPLLDLLIASIVIDSGMTLVTSDAHFREIKPLSTIFIKP